MSSFANRSVQASFVCISLCICLCLAGCGRSRDTDAAQMDQMSKKFLAALDDALKKGNIDGSSSDPRVVASWSCVFAREMAYVKGEPPAFAKRSPDEDQQRFYTTEEWNQTLHRIALQADRKVYFNEEQYRSFLEGVLGKEDYAKVETIRNHWRYFDKLKMDYK